MKKDWLNENPAKGNNLLESVNRGTYTKENVKGFFADIANGITKNQAARNNSIPKGSVWHVFNSGVIS